MNMNNGETLKKLGFVMGGNKNAFGENNQRIFILGNFWSLAFFEKKKLKHQDLFFLVLHSKIMWYSNHATFNPNESQILSKSPGNPFAIQANWQNMSKEVVETEEERPVVVLAFSIFHPIRKMKKSVGGICYLIFRHICSNISEQKSITLHRRGV